MSEREHAPFYESDGGQDDIGRAKPRRPIVNIFLFLATLFTTWQAGLIGETPREQVVNGLLYMASVMGILLCHEMGHYLMAKKNRIEATLPYFIPFPFPLSPFGTMGAVIAMKGRIRSRNALMEVGAAGPLAGLLVALPIILIGLSLSSVEPRQFAGLWEGQSILYFLLKRMIHGSIPEGYDVFLHPMAWAGWVGLLVTMLNLLPVGQLDGGHIFYALFGEIHAKVSQAVILLLPFVGGIMIYLANREAAAMGLTGDLRFQYVSAGASWFPLGVLLFVFFGRGKRRRHPPTEDSVLSPRHRAVGVLCMILFILLFIPVPLRIF